MKLLIVIALASVLAPCSVRGQSVTPAPIPDTALSDDMRLLDAPLLARARNNLERYGTSFGSYALYIADSAGPPRVLEIGPQSFVESRDPSVMRDSLRSALRQRNLYSSDARTIGIITDSIAGDIREAIDGADGPGFPRMAIAELEDKGGMCRRVERDYRFVKDSTSEWGFGRVVFDTARITACAPQRFWPADTAATPAEPERPHLARPIERRLNISSLQNYFSVVGEFKGKLTVFDDSIVVKFDRLLATRLLPNDTQAVRLDSIRVGVGVGDNEHWSPIDDSKALRIGRALPKGGRITRRNVRFVLLHERRVEDDSAWIVVTFHITAGRPGEPQYSRQATTYAHSVKGILAEDVAQKSGTQ